VTGVAATGEDASTQESQSVDSGEEELVRADSVDPVGTGRRLAPASIIVDYNIIIDQNIQQNT